MGCDLMGSEGIAHGRVAEWSKALDLGSSLSGGVGSNPTSITIFCFLAKDCRKRGNQRKSMFIWFN